MTPRTLSMERFGRSAVAELLKGLTTQQLQRRFDELHVESPNNDSSALGFAMTSLCRFAPHAVVSVAHPHLSASVLPGAEVLVRARSVPTHVFDFLRALDLRNASLVVHQSSNTLPGESDLEALKNELRRLQPRRAVFPAVWGVVDV